MYMIIETKTETDKGTEYKCICPCCGEKKYFLVSTLSDEFEPSE